MNANTKNQLQRCLRDVAQASNIQDVHGSLHDRSEDCLNENGLILNRIVDLMRDLGLVASILPAGEIPQQLPSVVIWGDSHGTIYCALRQTSSRYRVRSYASESDESFSFEQLAERLKEHPGIVMPLIAHSFLAYSGSESSESGQQRSPSSGKSKSVKFRDVWPLMKSIIAAEKRDILIVVVYSVFISLLGLVVPLSSQAVVNAVALGVFSRQLVVLCIIVFLAMIVTAVMVVFERHLIDVIQRRLFVTTAFDIVHRIPRIREDAVRSMYMPELVNRFFDVITVQKVVGKFLLEGIGALLMLLTGLLVLFLYHPFFLVYDLVFLAFIPVLIFILGKGSLTTALGVSNAKYDTAAWLEEVARNQRSIKLDSDSEFSSSRLDGITVNYIDAKARHYRIIARQMLGSYVFKAFATVGILALGGILVLEQAISLGQLVAAEIIIIMIIGAIEKLLTQFDEFYDFAAALYKLQSIAKLPSEEAIGDPVPLIPAGGSIELDSVSFVEGSSSVVKNISLSIRTGEHVSIVGGSGSGKSTVAKLILGLLMPTSGHIRVNGVDTRIANLASLRSHVGYLDPDDSLMPGTVYDNIVLGRNVPQSSIDEVLRLCLLDGEIKNLPKGVRTEIVALGANLSYSVRRRILLARVLLSKPDIVIVDSAFQGLEDGLKMKLIESLMNNTSCTVVNVSVDTDIIAMTDKVHVLTSGTLMCSGTLDEVLQLRPDLEPLLVRRSWTGGRR
ncbi:MAG: ATP-binding cassette domain-containing protein [Candidatus Kapabacteria bacterium]|nr:ATP-binding cassette domain-containing protein [Candidatus Kapabacteria bacterium]